MTSRKGTGTAKKPSEPVVKRPFGRSRNIDELLGDNLGGSGSPGELGQSFLHAASVKRVREAAAEEAPGESIQNESSVEAAVPTDKAQAESSSQPSASSLDVSASNDHFKLPLEQIVQNKKLQPRLQVDEDHVIFLSNLFQKEQQQVAILVRRVDQTTEAETIQYEIIAGNHRFLAAKRLGWKHILARVLDVTFEEARLIAVSDMDSQRPTSGYEKAVAYQALLDDGLVNSQTDLAERYDVSKATISQLMSFMKLPGSVRAILDDHPTLFTYRVAVDLCKLIDNHKGEDDEPSPKVIDVVTQGVERLIDGKPVASLLNWIEQQLSGKPLFTPAVSPGIVLDQQTRIAFKTKRKDRSVVVEWGRDSGFSPGDVEEALLEALKALATKREASD